MSKRNLIFPYYPNLVLKRLTQDTTVAELIEVFNYNFEQIYMHKGIKGEKGDTGSRGIPGLTRKGDKGDKGDRGNHVTVTSTTGIQDGDPVTEFNPDGTPKNPGDIVMSADGSVYSVYSDGGVLRYKKEMSLINVNKDLFKTIRTYKELGHIIQGHTIKDYNSTGIVDNIVMLGTPMHDPLTNEVYSNYYAVALGVDREIPGDISTLSLTNIIRDPYDRTTKLPKEQERRNKQITLWYRQHYKHNTITDTGYTEISYAKVDNHMRAIFGTKYAGIGMYTDVNTLGSISVLGNRNKSVMSISADTILFTGAVAGIPPMTPAEWDYLKMSFNPAEDSVLFKYKRKMDIGDTTTELEVYGDLIIHTLRCSTETHYRIEKGTGLLNTSKGTDQAYIVIDNANSEELKGITGLSHNSIVITEFTHTTTVRKNINSASGQVIQLNGNESITFKPGQIVIWKYSNNTLKLLTGATDQDSLIKMIAQISRLEDNYYSINPDPTKKKGHPLPVATPTKAGIVKLATEVEATDSSNNTVALTPYSLSTLIPTKTSVYNIGKWDMSKTRIVTVSHDLGTKWTKVVGIDVMIFPDELTKKIRLGDPDGIDAGHSVAIDKDNITITLHTLLGEDFNSIGINRGHVEVRYYEKLEEPTIADAIIRITQDSYNLQIPFASPNVIHSLGYSIDSMGGQIEGIEWSVKGGEVSQVTFSGNDTDNPKQIVFSKEGSYSIEMNVVTEFQGKRNKTPKLITYTVTKQTDITPPTAPVLSTNRLAQTEVGLIWTQSIDSESGVKEYRLLRDGEKIESGQTLLEYTDRTVTPDKSYRYVVEVEDNAGNTSRSNEIVANTPPTSTLTVSAGGNKTVPWRELGFEPPEIVGVILTKYATGVTDNTPNNTTIIPLIKHGKGYNRNSLGFRLSGEPAANFQTPFFGIGRQMYNSPGDTRNTVNPNAIDGQWGWNLLLIQSYDYLYVEIWVQSTDLGNIMKGVYVIEIKDTPFTNSINLQNDTVFNNVYNMDWSHVYYPLLGTETYKHHKITGVNIPVTGSAISTGATLTGMTWELVSKPGNSTAVLEGTTTNSTTIKDVNKHGDHTLKLTASNNNNQTNSDIAVISVSDPRQNTRTPRLMIVDSLRKAKNIMLENRDEAYRTGQFTSPGNHRIEVQHNLSKYRTGNKLSGSNIINGSARPETENVFLVPDVTGILNVPVGINGNIQNLQWQYSVDGGNWMFIPPLYMWNYINGDVFMIQEGQKTLVSTFSYVGGQLKDLTRFRDQYVHPASGRLQQSQLEDVWTNGNPICVTHMFADTTKGNSTIKWRYRYMTWEGVVSPWSNEVEVVFLKGAGYRYNKIQLKDSYNIGYMGSWNKNSNIDGVLRIDYSDIYNLSMQSVFNYAIENINLTDTNVAIYVRNVNNLSGGEHKISSIAQVTRRDFIEYGYPYGSRYQINLYTDNTKAVKIDSVIISETSVPRNSGGGGGGSYWGGRDDGRDGRNRPGMEIERIES
mgnify:CR=1 FL=1|jgi:hypothetical protein|nr:MAG TPA: Chitinase [Caudoviricetes sp.]